MNTSKSNQSENRRIFEREILEDDIEIRKEFLHHCEHEISNFIDAITVAYEKWKQFDSNFSSESKQNSSMVGFLYKAINDLTISMKLLISGHLSSSGNLIRQTIESISSAILFSNKELPYWELFNEKKFSPDKAIHCVLKNSKKLKTNKKAIIELKKLVKEYSDYSHSSLLSLSSYMSFSDPEKIKPYIGGVFDKSRLTKYKMEINRMLNLSHLITNTIEGLSLNKDSNHP